MNCSSVLLLFWFIWCSKLKNFVFSMYRTIITNGKVTRFTVFYINIARMSRTDLFVWDVVEFIPVCHNMMVYCSKIFNMVFFTLCTQITWAWFTIVLCVLRTLRTQMYSIQGACWMPIIGGHDVDRQCIPFKISWEKIKMNKKKKIFTFIYSYQSLTNFQNMS